MSRTQFSLRTLLAAVAVVGIGAALWVAEPSWQLGAVEALLLAWVPGSAVVLSLHSTGKMRAFWIGCAINCLLLSIFAVAMGWFVGLDVPPDENVPGYFGNTLFALAILSNSFRTFLLIWAFAPVVGLLCVFTHWLLIRPPQGPTD